MKIRTITAAVACLWLGGLFAQNIMELNEKQQMLVVVAACEAKGDIDGLKTALHEGLESGLTVSEAREALATLYLHRFSTQSERVRGIAAGADRALRATPGCSISPTTKMCRKEPCSCNHDWESSKKNGTTAEEVMIPFFFFCSCDCSYATP